MIFKIKYASEVFGHYVYGGVQWANTMQWPLWKEHFPIG